MSKTYVYALSMPLIFLMNCFDNGRIFCRIFIGNFSCAIFGTIIDNDDFHLFSSCQQCINTTPHIVLRVVTWHGKCNQFHEATSFLFFVPSKYLYKNIPKQFENCAKKIRKLS